MTNAKSYYNVTQDNTAETYKASDFMFLEAGTCGTEALSTSIITLVHHRDTTAHNEWDFDGNFRSAQSVTRMEADEIRSWLT